MQEKIVQTKTCKHCDTSFDITDKDLEFYDKVSPVFDGKKYAIPTPTFCPDCRQQRRLSWINEINLFKSICKGCGTGMVSRFHPESGLKVFCNKCWSNENWDQLKQGSDIDFNISFFSQISELIKKSYYQNLIGSSSNIKNNAVYTNHTSEIHNSYYVFEANKIQDSYYGYNLKSSKNVVDSMFIGDSEYIYECVDCYKVYKTYYSKKSYGCKFSYFLDNCYNCSHCFGCINLNNKDYYLFNEPISKKEYDELKLKLSKYSFLMDFEKKAYDFFKKEIKKTNNLVGSENCSGDNIINSNNCLNPFDVLGCSDCKNCNSVSHSNDMYDISSFGEESNNMCDSVSVGRYSNNILFSSIIGKGEKLVYCIDVKKCSNCFLCVNLSNKKYCILNKQYSKEQYEKLVPKIIEHMRKRGEWGEFFPSSLSPFGYNETVANEYFPLKREEVLGEGFSWSDYEAPPPIVEKIIPASKLPEKIDDVPDDILNWAIECEVTKKPFRIIAQELEFYRKHNLPAPRRHPDQRHLDRMRLRNPWKIYDRKCDKCEKLMKTTYSLERPEIVYCEECYNKEIY